MSPFSPEGLPSPARRILDAALRRVDQRGVGLARPVVSTKTVG
ncbi:MAG TPA: hypothetical protein VFT03_09330 [Rubrobacteraceae bacterium]|nr:hypothetical protein [Rubrobacteraceae bacterium]